MKAREIEMMKEAAGMQREGFGEEVPAAKPEAKAEKPAENGEAEAKEASEPEKPAPKQPEKPVKRVRIKL